MTGARRCLRGGDDRGPRRIALGLRPASARLPLGARQTLASPDLPSFSQARVMGDWTCLTHDQTGQGRIVWASESLLHELATVIRATIDVLNRHPYH
jgi:hypothetical protein